jgi:flagellar biosynthesis protein FlhA
MMSVKAVGRQNTQTDLILIVAVIGILLILFTPIPPALLDVFLIINFSFALLLLLLTFYVDKPLAFSTFPSLLLIATLFRLALNISATRLILSDADAGHVIEAVGTHVVQGNYVIGLIVFFVLIVVQYVVVTNGAQRVAEVAARFTLDSMPGKQMAIDADLNAGLVDEKQARERRKKIEQEGNFYGAMDGASKFVKGDAIAGIIIILIDIIGGLIIGVAQLGMPWGEALHTFTLLTVGDGIVTQIPALIIATGTGIIVTRASSDEFLSREISAQITAYPKALLLIAAGLIILTLLPGIPVFPVLFVLALVSALAVFAYRARKRAREADPADDKKRPETTLYDEIAVEPIEISIGPGLVTLAGGEQSALMDRIVTFRRQHAMDVGFVIPKVRVRDNKKLAPNAYSISINGAKVGDGELMVDHVLAIDPGDAKGTLQGAATKDPTYGLNAVWIDEEQRVSAKQLGYTLVEPLTVLMTHVSEAIRRHSHELLSRGETERLVNRVKTTEAGLIEELIPNVLTISDVQKVLQNLLREKVSIRNLEQILEVLVDQGKQVKAADILTEVVRQRLANMICHGLADREGTIYVLTLDPTVEQTLAKSVRGEANKGSLVIEPKFAEQVLARLSHMVEQMLGVNRSPVLLCPPELRRHIRQFTERMAPNLAVLSLAEIPTTVTLKSFGMIKV